jgi:X-Pro dipeptidyl-peptidase C-terminal non-catalytic domain
VRARYRNGFGKAELLKSGQPYEFTIEMYPTSLVFKKGHRIRLDISSSNFPRFDINPNTGEPLNNNRRSQVAGNTIYLDAKHPSQIVLPVIPAETTDTSARGSGGNDGRRGNRLMFRAIPSDERPIGPDNGQFLPNPVR